MDERRRKNITSGVLLIVIGAIFLAFRLIPDLRQLWAASFTWPMTILIVALGLLVIGALTGTADMLVPACIVGGIGGILYLQNAGALTWQSWAYLWTLIPGFAGIGQALAGLVKWKRKDIADGLQAVLVSAVLFLIFGSLMGDLFGYFPLRAYLPYVLIALGVLLLIRAFVAPRRRSAE